MQTEITDTNTLKQNRWYHRWALIFSASLVIAFFSEYYFVNEGVVIIITGYLENPAQLLWHQVELMLWYAGAIAPFIWLSYYYRVNTLASLFLAGAAAGYFIEALIVPAVYFELPISILWTALSWHPLVDVLFGFYLFQFILRSGSVIKIVATSAILGLLWGAWSTWMVGSESEIEQVTGLFEYYELTTAASFFFIATAVLLVGNIMLDRLSATRFEISKPEAVIIALITAALFVLMALMVGVLVLILPLMLAVFWVGLCKSKRSDDQKSFMEVFAPRVPMFHHALVLVMPIVATASYYLMAEFGLVFPLELITITMMLAAIVLLPWAIIRLWKGKEKLLVK